MPKPFRTEGKSYSLWQLKLDVMYILSAAVRVHQNREVFDCVEIESAIYIRLIFGLVSHKSLRQCVLHLYVFSLLNMGSDFRTTITDKQTQLTRADAYVLTGNVKKFALGCEYLPFELRL